MAPAETPTLAADRRQRRPPDATLAWVRRTFGERSRVASVEPLGGGMSHANHAITLETPDGAEPSVVLRRWVRPDWAETDPDFSPEQEIATYSLLAASEVPTPRLIAADPRAGECDVAAILLTKAPGDHVTAPADRDRFARALADVLPSIHGVDPQTASRAVPSYRPYADPTTIRAVAWATRPDVWERAIDVLAGPPPPSRRTFIHRDYHPGNTLWRDGRVSAVLDWSTASFGPPGIDLAHMRANLAMLYDLAMADSFLRAYDATAGLDARSDHDPWWDLQDAAGFLGDLDETPSLPPIASSGPRLEAYVEHALAQLGR